MHQAITTATSLLTCASLLWVGGCARSTPTVARAPAHAQVARPSVWTDPTRPAVPVAEDEVLARARRARFVLLGEVHDQPLHHALQAELIARIGGRRSVVFEMLDLERQSTIDQIQQNTSEPTEASERLAQAVHWERTGWPAWPVVQPVFVAAMAGPHRVVAGGVPRSAFAFLFRPNLTEDRPSAEWVMADVPGNLLSGLPASFLAPVPADLDGSLREELRASHCGQLPNAMLSAMVVAQHLRDARMAERMLATAGADGAFLVAGSGHVRRDRGVPFYLQRAGHVSRFGPEDVVIFGMAEGEPSLATRYVGIYDYVLVSPPIDRPAGHEPCRARSQSSLDGDFPAIEPASVGLCRAF